MSKINSTSLNIAVSLLLILIVVVSYSTKERYQLALSTLASNERVAKELYGLKKVWKSSQNNRAEIKKILKSPTLKKAGIRSVYKNSRVKISADGVSLKPLLFLLNRVLNGSFVIIELEIERKDAKMASLLIEVEL